MGNSQISLGDPDLHTRVRSTIDVDNWRHGQIGQESCGLRERLSKHVLRRTWTMYVVVAGGER